MDFNDWFENWYKTRYSNVGPLQPLRPLRECMLDAFLAGREAEQREATHSGGNNVEDLANPESVIRDAQPGTMMFARAIFEPERGFETALFVREEQKYVRRL